MFKSTIFFATSTLAALLLFLTIPPPPTTIPTVNNYFRTLFTSLSDNSTIAHHLLALTHRPHSAGTEANAAATRHVIAALLSHNLRPRVAPYQVSLTLPTSRALTLTTAGAATAFELRQETYPGDPYADVAGEILPTFHAYAKSGTAVGPAAYANYGRAEDFAELRRMGVNVTGAVVVARYGEVYRGDIVRNAGEAGAVGVVVFSDRKDYGGGGGWFPEGRWLPPSGVQVGSVYRGAGDPTTPGWGSVVGEGECERVGEEEVERGGEVGMIPSLPVSAADGEVIMRAVGGAVAEEDGWQGAEDAPVYRVGPGPGVLNLTYSGRYVLTRIENVIAMIEGVEEPDRFVILGNHRDAWTFGAVDPNSGTAVLLEIARRLRKLQKQGWKPRRTIILCNWDAEEYGLIGSTEWVEENREMLASRVVAYLNADSAVSRSGFHASATPQLDDLLKRVAQQVQDPDNASRTIYDSWIGSGSKPTIGRLGGGGSDYAPFVQHVGIPATDVFFGGGYPVYHSMYDDFVWMTKFGDPVFQRHVAAASIWGLLALHLSDDEFLPFNYVSYANELQACTKDFKDDIYGKGINLTPLYKSIQELEKAAAKINNQIKEFKEITGWASKWRKKEPIKVRELNDRLMMAERAFADRDGLLGRPWYKHLVYAPSQYNDYGSRCFPGIDDAINKAKSLNTRELWRRVQHEVWRVSRAITQASLVLGGELK